VFVASIRGFSHQDAQISGGDRSIRELQRDRAAFCFFEMARWEYVPLTLRACIEVQCSRAGPIFHLGRSGVGAGPCNADSIHWLFPVQVDDDPLRMQGVTFASKSPGQVTIAACRESTMRKGIGEDVADRISQVGAAGEISAATCRITPSSVLCPVPGRPTKLTVVPICDRTPAAQSDSCRMWV
jgi:hypothetical protein